MLRLTHAFRSLPVTLKAADTPTRNDLSCPLLANRRLRSLFFIAAAVALTTVAIPAAAAQRTFVHSSPIGADANASLVPPCALATPCRTFNVAIGVTDPAGEVVILDTAGYGPMVINKSIKVIGPSGVYGGISALGAGINPTTGVIINAGDTDVITLRGLDINGVPSTAPLPMFGIDIQNAGTVHIEKSSISNFTQDTSACINLTTAKAIQLFVTDSFLRECRNGVVVTGNGIDDTVRPSVVIDNTRIEHMLNTASTGTVAVRLADAFLVTVRNSVLAWAGDGVKATNNASSAVNSRVYVANSQITRMGNAAIETGGGAGAGLNVNVADSLLNFNSAGLLHGHGQAIFVTNVIANNANSLVDCGGGATGVKSLAYGGGNGSNAMYNNTDGGVPGGCTAYITPTQFAGK